MASLGSGMIYSGTNVNVVVTSGTATYTVPSGYIFVGQVISPASGGFSINGHGIMELSSGGQSVDLIVGPSVSILLSSNGVYLTGILIQNP